MKYLLNLIFSQVVHLLIERVPGPFAFLRFDTAPERPAGAHDVDADLGHLRDPFGKVLRCLIAGADAEGAEVREIGRVRYWRVLRGGGANGYNECDSD